MSGVNKLMFQVGIEEVERKLSSVRAEYDSFAEKYKDGITIKLKLDEAESLASSLSKIGDPKAPMPYLDEIERLKKLLGDAKNAIDFLLSLFYIKPQLQRLRLAVSRIVFYLFSTSNHNLFSKYSIGGLLSFISFLHQTTTDAARTPYPPQLSFISFLHQTTTSRYSRR